MPASIFELLYINLYIHGRDGKAPSYKTLSRELDCDYRSVVNRIASARKLSILADVGVKKGKEAAGHWFVLTAYGADLFVRCLSEQADIFLWRQMRVSPNPNSRPSDIEYVEMDAYRYREKYQELVELGESAV